MTGRIVGAIIVGFIIRHFVGYFIFFYFPFDLVALAVCTFIAYQLFFSGRMSKGRSVVSGGSGTIDRKPTDEYTEAMAIRDKLNQTRAQNNEPPV